MNEDKLNSLWNMRPEWLNDRKDNIIDVSYNQGWNACNKVWLSNLASLCEETNDEVTEKETSDETD